MTIETRTNVQDQLAQGKIQAEGIFGKTTSGYVNTKGYDPLNNWQRTSPWDTQTRTLPYITTSTSTGEVKKEEKEVSIDIENVEVTQIFIDELIKIVTTGNVDLYLKGVTIKKEIESEIKIAVSKERPKAYKSLNKKDEWNEPNMTINKHIHEDENGNQVIGRDDVLNDPLSDVIEKEVETTSWNKEPEEKLEKITDPLSEVPTEAYEKPIVKGEKVDPMNKTEDELKFEKLENMLATAKEREIRLEKRIEELSLFIHNKQVLADDPLDYAMDVKTYDEEFQDEMKKLDEQLNEHDLKTK